jgi:hypothetical protein
MIRYVILSGPPKSGKSTIARELAGYLRNHLDKKEELGSVITDSFAAPLKHFVCAALSEKYELMDRARARPELNGHTVRELMIGLAEDYIKEIYGKDVFGRWLVHRSLRAPNKKPDFVVVDDGGFEEEIDAVPNRYVINVQRAGKTFDGDSRKYYQSPNDVLMNDGTLMELWFKLNVLAGRLVKGEYFR